MTENTTSLVVNMPADQVIQLKIIYWGPAEAGKTTSLLAVAAMLGAVDGCSLYI